MIRGHSRHGSRFKNTASIFSLNFVNSQTLSPAITFSRANNATYISSTGMVEFAQANMIMQSEKFNTSPNSPVRSTVTEDITIAPDGAITGNKIVATAVANTHSIQQNATCVSGMMYTLSVYAKAAEYNFVSLIPGSTPFGVDQWATFNLSTGEVSSTGTTNVSPTITNVGNGWYRVTVSATAIATSISNSWALCYFPTDPGTRNPSYTGDAVSGIYIWGAQVNPDGIQNYIATTTTEYYAPRFDFDPATLVCRGLLIEEARTNSILQSQNFSTTWTTATATVVANDVTSPSGDIDADALVDDATINAHAVTQTVTTTAVHWAYSCFVKAGTRNWVYFRTINSAAANIRTWFDVSTGTVGTQQAGTTGTIQAYPNGWYRCTMIVSAPFVGANAFFISAASADNSTSYLGDSTKALYLWGAQAEMAVTSAGYPTSYIPTTTATATRPRDIATMTGINFSSWYNQTEGTVAVNIQWEGLKLASSQTILQIDDGTTANRIVFAASSSNSLLNVVTSAGVGTNVLTPATTYVAATSYKHAFAVSNLDFQLAINGTLGTQVTTGAMPISVNALRFGTNITTFASIWFQSLAYYPTRLPNATLQAITA